MDRGTGRLSHDAAVRATWAAFASRGPGWPGGPDICLVIRLAEALASRYDYRMRAGERAGERARARADLDEAVQLLAAALDQAGPRHPQHRAAALAAAAVYDERRLLAGDLADCDQAIEQLTAYLEPSAGPPEVPAGQAGPAPAAVHAALARLLGGRYEEAVLARPAGRQDAAALADLDAAIAHARAGLNQCGPVPRDQDEADTVAELLAWLRIGLACRSEAAGPGGRDPAAARADRDEAIEVLEAVSAAGAQERPEVTLTLGRLYLERDSR